MKLMSVEKKPIRVQAVKTTLENLREVEKWCGGEVVGTSEDANIHINTLEGVMRANIGDWIIKGVKNEFYPCKPEIFEQTYEIVEIIEDPSQLEFDFNA
jgi:hypothetical protein